MDEYEEDEEEYIEAAYENPEYPEEQYCCEDEYFEDVAPDDCEDHGGYRREEDSGERRNIPASGQDEHRNYFFVHSGNTARQPQISIAEGLYGLVFVVVMILFFIYFL